MATLIYYDFWAPSYDQRLSGREVKSLSELIDYIEQDCSLLKKKVNTIVDKPLGLDPHTNRELFAITAHFEGEKHVSLVGIITGPLADLK